MLKHLLIKNYALIRRLEMSLSDEFNIITGETGAGKSIMLGAIGLLLGNRAEAKALYDEEEKCVIEGQFEVKDKTLKEVFLAEELDYAEDCIIRREISPGGKTRAFINDTPVNLEVLKSIGSRLIDIHSQHENLLIGTGDFQLNLIDAYAGSSSLLLEYRADYKQYQTESSGFRKLQEAAGELKKEFDFNNYLLTELINANLKENEQEELDQEIAILEHAEEVKSKLNLSFGLISESEQSIQSSLYAVVNALNQIGKYSEKYSALKERTESTYIEIKDIARELEKEDALVNVDPERLDFVNQRLQLINSLLKKHQVSSLADLLKIKEHLDVKVKAALNLDEDLTQAQSRVTAALKKARESADKLSKLRLSKITELELTLIKLLAELGMANASVNIQHKPVDLNSYGMDDITLLFSANKGIKPLPLKNVASGGEFSRLMLCIKYILAAKKQMPTIIFDEIDTGVSGETAIKMARIMKEMAGRHQVIAITHLPQIAARGNSHYFVYKDESADKTMSTLKKLSEEERVMEIAKMIGGEKPSEISISNARELLTAEIGRN